MQLYSILPREKRNILVAVTQLLQQSVQIMTYEITARKGDSTGYDACCGASVITLMDDTLPDSHKENGVLYVYARCQKCGAIWRDGFKNGYTTTYNTPDGDVLFVETDNLTFEFTHVDTNKAHQGTVDIVEKPVEHPLQQYKETNCIDDDRIENEWELHTPDNYERRETWVYRFSEVDTSSTPGIKVGDSYFLDHPELYGDNEQIEIDVIVRVTDIAFDDDYNLISVTYTVSHSDVSLTDIPIVTDTTDTVNGDVFIDNFVTCNL